MNCPHCKKKIEKISVEERSYLVLAEKTKENAGNKYYCFECTKELDAETVNAALVQEY